MKKKQTKRTGWSLVTFEAIERVRRVAGKSRVAMAEALGVSYGTYHNWRSESCVPSLATQKRIKAQLDWITSNAPMPPESQRPKPIVHVQSEVSQHAVAAIVAAYLAHLPDRTVLSAEDLHEVTSGVMRTLGGARG